MDEAAPTVDRAGKARELLQKLRFMKGSEPKERHADIDARILKASAVIDEEDAKASADAEGNDVGYGEAAMRLGGEALVPLLHRYLKPMAEATVAGAAPEPGKSTIGERASRAMTMGYHPPGELDHSAEDKKLDASMGEAYDKTQGEELDRLKKTREQHQGMSIGADLLGIMFGPAAKAFGATERVTERLAAPAAEGLAQRLFTKGAAGGAGTGTYSAIKKFGEGSDVGESLKAGADAVPAGVVGGALVPGGPGLSPLKTAGASGAAGAAADATDALIHGENPADRTVNIMGVEVPSMLVSAIASAVVPTASSLRHNMIRNPKTQQGQAIEKFEAIGGKLRPVRGPQLPEEVATKYGEHPVSEAANETAGQAMKEHYDQDVADYKGFREQEKADSHGPQLPATEEHVREMLSTPQGQKAWSRVLKRRADDVQAGNRFEQSRGTVKHTLVDQPSFDPDLATTKTETPAFMSEVVGEPKPAEPAGDSSIWDELQYEPKNTQRRVKTPAEVEMSATKREMPASMAELTGGAEPTASKKPAKKTAESKDDPGIPETMDARDVMDLTREMRELGKVGKAAGRSEKPYKDQSARAREILTEVDPEGHGARMKEEGRQLSKAELRNEALGLQPKARIKPSPKKRETVARRLASLGGDDTGIAARKESISTAEALSPKLRARLPEIKGLQAYEHLRLLGAPLNIGLFGGKMGETAKLRMFVKDVGTKGSARLDPLIAGAERRNLAPSLLMESLHLGHKKKKSDEKEKQND